LLKKQNGTLENERVLSVMRGERMKTEMKIGDYVKMIGPAIVMAAVVVGPGTVTTASSMGSKYGYSLIWAAIVSSICGLLFQVPAVSLTLKRGVTIMEAIRMYYGKNLARVLFFLIYICVCISQSANFIGAAMALNYFVPSISLTVWAASMAGVALIMVLFYDYRLLEKFTEVLVLIMVGAFLITMVGSHPSLSAIASEGFSFRIPDGDYMLVLALLSTTMIYDLPISLSSLHKEKYLKPSSPYSKYPEDVKLKTARIDLVVGSSVSCLLTVTIMICSAVNLHPLGIQITNAADMAKQLTPIMGSYAGILFSLGLWGAAFSSGMFRMELLPMFIGQMEDREYTKKDPVVRACILGVAVIPVLFIFLFGSSPAQMVIVSQAITGLLLPITCCVVWKITGDRKFMGDAVNGTWFKVIFGIICILTLLLAGRTFSKWI